MADSYTKSLLHFNGTDASTSITDQIGKTWTAAGNAQLDTAQFKFGGSSLYLDGTGDYITTSDHNDFAVGSGDFTIDFWLKCASVPGAAYMYVLGQTNSALTSKGFEIDVSLGKIKAYFWYTSADIAEAESASAITDTDWHHAAIVRSGTSLKVYLDGVGGTSFNVTGLSFVDSSGGVSVGRMGDYTSGTHFNGWIDEFRFSKGFARWTANFTPPAVEYDSFTPRIMMIGE